MKTAVIKIGSRIAYGGRDTSGGNYEAKHIVEMLVKGGASVEIYTKILKKDIIPDNLVIWNIEDKYKTINEEGYDCLICINGNFNMFGGAECPDQILNYWIINKFKGPVFYIYCDPALNLKQVWGSIEKKEWASNWKKEDIYISRKDIRYISQPYDLDAVKDIICTGDIYIPQINYYPFEKFPCMDEFIPMKENPTVDLSYGGTMRGGKRIKKMLKYYFGYPTDIKVEMFGKIILDDFVDACNKIYGKMLQAPVFTKPVDAEEYLVKSNDSISHVVIGDQWYEGRDMPQRCYQSIWTSVITFIDIDLDPDKKVLGKSEICSKFNYVSSREDVEKRLRAIKDFPAMRKEIIAEQLNAIRFNEEEFCKGFVKLLNPKVNGYQISEKEMGETKKIKEKVINKQGKEIKSQSFEDILDMF